MLPNVLSMSFSHFELSINKKKELFIYNTTQSVPILQNYTTLKQPDLKELNSKRW